MTMKDRVIAIGSFMSFPKKISILLLVLAFAGACQTDQAPKKAEKDEGALSTEQEIVVETENSEAELVKVSPKFSQPYKIHGQLLTDASTQLGATLAKIGDRFTIEDETAKFYAEATDGNGVISYIEVGIKSLGECSPQKAISLSKQTMDLADVPTDSRLRATQDSGYVVYQVGKLTAKTFCPFEGGWYTVSISAEK
ncbi:MAG: hypothetical protein AAF959_05320 [Cyanobacteria bacterium P01_D01_bin.56]